MIPVQPPPRNEKIDEMARALVDQCVSADDPQARCHEFLDALSADSNWTMDEIRAVLDKSLALLNARIA